jgi:hypothetical protein
VTPPPGTRGPALAARERERERERARARLISRGYQLELTSSTNFTKFLENTIKMTSDPFFIIFDVKKITWEIFILKEAVRR